MNIAVLYSTGPIELDGSNTRQFIVKILNNSPKDTATGKVRVFSLNGGKSRIANPTFYIPPLSSDFFSFDVKDEAEVEFQIRVDSLNGATNEQITSFVLPSVWGKNPGGVPQTEHRLVTAEIRIVRPIGDSE